MTSARFFGRKDSSWAALTTSQTGVEERTLIEADTERGLSVICINKKSMNVTALLLRESHFISCSL